MNRFYHHHWDEGKENRNFRLDNVNKEPAEEMRKNEKNDEKSSGLTLKIPKEVSCFPKGKIQFVKK
jgi:hypothetical protein